MKPGVYVGAADSLNRKVVEPAGCLGWVQKAGLAWLGRGLWFLAGVVVGTVWGNG